MTLKIYKKTNEENCQQFVTRVVNTEDRPMRPQDVLDVCYKVGFKKSKGQVHSHLADCIRSNLITKWRDTERKCVVYAPLSHKAPAIAPLTDEQVSKVIKHNKDAIAMDNTGYIPYEPARDQRAADELLSSRSYPNFLTTLANYYQVSVKQVQKVISDVINDITMNDNDDKANTLITCLKDICAEAFE